MTGRRIALAYRIKMRLIHPFGGHNYDVRWRGHPNPRRCTWCGKVRQ